MDSTRRNYRVQSGESAFSKLFHPKVEKVQPASGLSRPRLVKVRRQFPSSRVRPGLEDPLGSGTYPDASSEQLSNRDVAAASVNIDRNSGGLNPQTADGENFVSLTGQASNSYERNLGRAETAFSSDFFVFGKSSDQSMASDRRKFGGTAAENLPEEFQRLNFNYSGTSEKPQKSNNSAFVFNSSKTTSESIGEDNYAPGSFSFRNSSMGRGIPDLNSSFRSSGEKLPHYLSQLDINDSSSKNMPGDARKTIPSAGIFDFQATTSHTSDKENLDSALPGEMRKLKIEVPEKDSGLNKTEGSYSSSRAEEVQSFSFMFGSKNGIGVQEMKAVNPFEKNKDPDRKADDGFDESSTGKLPEEIQNLKIRDPENDDTAGSSSRNFVFSSSKSASGSFCEENNLESFMFGVNKGTETVNSPKKTADQFAFRKPSAKNSAYVQRSNDHFHASVAEKLPEEIQKLKIKDPDNDNNAGKTNFGGSFVFISSQSVLGSSIKETATDKFMFGSKGKGFDPNSSEFVVSSGGFESYTTANGNISGPDNASTAAVDNENSSSKTEGSDYVSACSSFTSDGGKCFSSLSGENYSSTGFVFGKSSQESKFHDHNELPESHGADTPSGKVVDRGSEFSLDDSGAFVRNSGKSNLFALGSDFSFGNTTSVDPSSQSCNHNANSEKPNIEENVRPISVSWRVQQENNSKREDTILGTCDSASFLNGTSNAKKGVSSHVRARKRRGKLKESLSFSYRNNAGTSLREKISQVKPNLDSQGDYSPMDFSPCFAEGQVGEEYSREASVASEESITTDSTHILNSINTSFSANGSAEDLADVAVKSSSLESSEQAYANSGFTFSASSSAQSSFSSSKHSHRRKFRSKVGRNDFVSISDQDVQLFPNLKESSHLDGKKAQTEVHKTEAETNKASHIKEHISMSASATTAQENCEKWRLRGNQAYSTGDLCKAEDYYTRGVKSVSPAETSLSCRRTLMLCYSNRAAARMSNGRIREALSDCMMAAEIDPGFLRAQLRAASCHLQLGETEEACNRFMKCLHGGCDSSHDQKFFVEASDGLQKVKVVADCIEKASSLLQKGTINDAITVLQITSDALSLSPYSESLIEMKAEALLLLRRYEELILLLDQTLESAEKNSSTPCNKDQEEDYDYSRSTSSRSILWRVYLKSRAYFYLGKLDEALALMNNNGQVKAVTERDKSDSWALLSTTVSELLRLKVAGNTAFKSGKHSDAVEHYTAALTYNIESRPFTAVCFCNRAAAYQALGQITEAISDCSLAIALDPNYRKAISRRATLHEMIRDYSQAANDMRRLISLMERNNADKIGSGRHANNGDDLDSARLRLSQNEDKSRKEIPLDMYKILGVEASSDVAEIKKAYRKAALRHHPDKASQLLVRSDNTDEKLWKEMADEVHRDADRLFKMIGEAYAILSDPTKRQVYDINEEIRVLKERSHVSSTSTTQPGYHYYRSNSGYHERESDAWHRPYNSSGPRSSRSYRTGRYY